MRRSRFAILLASLALAAAPLAAPLAAQGFPTLDGKIPPRPKLPAGLDTNDAGAYHEWAVGHKVDWRQK